MLKPSILQRVERAINPSWALRRDRARIAIDMLERSYEGATGGRRSQGWKKTLTDQNAETFGQNQTLRNVARELVRNNGYAESALQTICDHVVGWGIAPSEAPEIWKQWAETTDCDASGRNDFYGLQKLVLRTVAESGECFVRRRVRLQSDLKSESNPNGLSLPLQLQVLEPDYLDTTKDGSTETGGVIIQGVEFNAIGKRVFYWMFPEHPGSRNAAGQTSSRVPAESILHIYQQKRPGQVRGVTWFAPILLRFKDFDDFEDATLMKQKVAACLAVVISDPDGAGNPIGIGDPSSSVDSLQPGIVMTAPPGRKVDIVQPPNVQDYEPYAKNQLRGIATGIGVTYEDLTGDYTEMPFSAARMSRLRHWSRVEGWRWSMLTPQLLNPVWAWVAQSAGVMGIEFPETPEWNAPPMPFIEPDKEGLAAMRNIRAGIQTLTGWLREQGLNPERHLKQLAADLKTLDDLGLVLDLDPRRLTQQGQAQFDDRFDPIYKSEKTKAAQAAAAAEASVASASSGPSKES